MSDPSHESQETVNVTPPANVAEKQADGQALSITSGSPPERTMSGVSMSEFQPSKRLYVAFLTLAVITLMVALDGTTISVALPIISQKLGGTAIEAFWSGTSFLLCSTIFQPSFASFSHIFGRKPMVFTGLTFFMVGSLIAALANDFAQLLVGRSLQGLGGGGLIALTEIVVTDLVPLRLRGQWFGIISAMWSVGSVAGPPIGGVLAQDASWRWIFYINLPFIGVAYVFVWIFLKLNFKASNFSDQLRRVDWIGSVLFIGSTTSFLIPITWGGVSYAWDSWRTLVPLIVGTVGLIVFVLYEEYVAVEPLIRLTIFKNRTAAAAYVDTVLHGLILWCLLYYLPLYYEAVKGETPIISGISLFPETFTVAPTAVATGITVTKTGRYRFAIWTGWILTITGLGLLYLLDVNTSVVQQIFLNLVSGLGLGMLFPSLAFAIQAATPSGDLAFAVAMYSFFRAFGQAIGVAIGGTIFQNTMKRKLLKYVLLAPKAAEYSHDASALVQIIKQMAPGQARTELVQSYADSLKMVYIVMCALSVVAGLCSIAIQGLDLNRPLETEQGFLERERTKDEER